MEEQAKFDMQHIKDNEDVASLTELLGTAWQARWRIILATSLIVIVSVSSALYMAQYKSEGFFQFGGAIPLPAEKKLDAKEKDPASGIALADYKRYAAAFGTAERYADFIKYNQLNDAPGADQLRKIFIVRDGIDKVVEPVYPFSKLDAKELEQPRDGSNTNVIGLRLSFESDSPQKAQRTVGLLGRFVMDSIIYLSYEDSLRVKTAEMNAKITKLDNHIIDSNQSLEEYQRKGESLKQIVSRYPDSAQNARQLVTVTEDNARYLSPITQLTTSEVRIVDLKEIITKAKRDRQQAVLLRDYYDKARAFMNQTRSGEVILRGLEAVKEAAFKNKDLNDDTIKEVYNTISIENQSALSLYLEKSRFIAGPSLPERRSSRLSSVILTSGLLGLLFSVILVFGSKWWRENRQKLNS